MKIVNWLMIWLEYSKNHKMKYQQNYHKWQKVQVVMHHTENGINLQEK